MTKQNRKQAGPAAGLSPFPTPLPCNAHTCTYTQLLEAPQTSQTVTAGRAPADNPGVTTAGSSCSAANSSHRGLWGLASLHDKGHGSRELGVWAQMPELITPGSTLSLGGLGKAGLQHKRLVSPRVILVPSEMHSA